MSDKRLKVAIIGHFGGDKTFLDGQTIKTKVLYNELERLVDWELIKVDTYIKQESSMKLLKLSLASIRKADAVILLVHENGVKVFLPMLYFAAKVWKKPCYFDVIGGDLPLFTEQNPKYKTYLKAFKSIWVETRRLRKAMEEVDVYNTIVLPNFKKLPIVKEEELLQVKEGDVFRFCTFSRVIKEKGIEDAMEAVKQINAEAGKTVCELDIYGQIGPEYVEPFEALMKEAPEAIQYKGEVPFTESTDVIKQYYALLFPTYWRGECFPGTIIDAFAAGTPVIASDWNSNGEIIRSGESGLVYPCEQGQDLKAAMEWAIAHTDEMYEMSRECLSEAYNFGPEVNIARIKDIVEKDQR